MTAPVLNTEDEGYMSFLLPFEHQSITDVPEPTDARVKIEKVDSNIIAAVEFSGSYDKTVCQKHFLVSILCFLFLAGWYCYCHDNDTNLSISLCLYSYTHHPSPSLLLSL